MTLDLKRLVHEVDNYDGLRIVGKLQSVEGGYQCQLPAAIGDQCHIIGPNQTEIPAEVVQLTGGLATVAPYESMEHVRLGMSVVRSNRPRLIPVGDPVLGRILDGFGRPIDEKGPLQGAEYIEVDRSAPSPMHRARISEAFVTGQRVIDGLFTCGRGQRVGIFSGSGVGKSTLLGQIARHSEADVNVVALVGERGLELRPFIEDCLGDGGMQKSIVVMSTCEQLPLMRIRSVDTAIAIADYYRNQGANVLFLLDSLTRLAMAQRQLGLSLGEPPSSRGYTPSVFQLMAESLERLGNSNGGSITSFVTVLVDGDDLDEPVSDASRALLDGHIILDRRLAEQEHFPAISVARSVSRVSREIMEVDHREAARKLRSISATYADVEDLIRIGAYVKGSNPLVEQTLKLVPHLNQFLRQDLNQFSTLDETKAAMYSIAAEWPE